MNAKRKSFQKKVAEFVEKYHLEHSAEVIALDLVSEIGEVSKEILRTTNYGRQPSKGRYELEIELGDVFYSLIALANYYGINLERSLSIALQKYENRLRKFGNAGSKIG